MSDVDLYVLCVEKKRAIGFNFQATLLGRLFEDKILPRYAICYRYVPLYVPMNVLNYTGTLSYVIV